MVATRKQRLIRKDGIDSNLAENEAQNRIGSRFDSVTDLEENNVELVMDTVDQNIMGPIQQKNSVTIHSNMGSGP